MEDIRRLYANIMPFHISFLSIHGFWYLRGPRTNPLWILRDNYTKILPHVYIFFLPLLKYLKQTPDISLFHPSLFHAVPLIQHQSHYHTNKINNNLELYKT